LRFRSGSLQSTSRRTSGRRERLKRRSRRFPADAKRDSQLRLASQQATQDSSFAIAIFLRSRSLYSNVLLALRSAARTGARVAAYRLCALSQIDERVESERTFCLFSQNLGVLRTPLIYLTQPHIPSSRANSIVLHISANEDEGVS
jgi:hypothetical protein